VRQHAGRVFKNIHTHTNKCLTKKLLVKHAHTHFFCRLKIQALRQSWTKLHCTRQPPNTHRSTTPQTEQQVVFSICESQEPGQYTRFANQALLYQEASDTADLAIAFIVLYCIRTACKHSTAHNRLKLLVNILISTISQKEQQVVSHFM
jgi:hypothetical protein